MKKLLYGLILLSLHIYAQESDDANNDYVHVPLVIDLDHDSLDDKVYFYKQGYIECELSTKGYQKIKSGFMEDMNFSEMKYLTPTKHGFELHLNWMRAGSSYQFVYDKSAHKIRWSGYKSYSFGNAVNEGSGEETLNLLTNCYHAQWHTFDHAKDKLIALKPIKVKTNFRKIYLDEFNETTVSTIMHHLPGHNSPSEQEENKTLLDLDKQLRKLFKDQQYAQMANLIQEIDTSSLVVTAKNVKRYAAIGQMLATAGITKKAVDLSLQIILRYPNETLAYKALGDAYDGDGDPIAANAAYRIYAAQMLRYHPKQKISSFIRQEIKIAKKKHLCDINHKRCDFWGKRFRLVNTNTKEPLPFTAYRLQAQSGETLQGVSNENGKTRYLRTKGSTTVTLTTLDN